MVKARYLLFYVLLSLLLTPAMVFSADLEGLYPPMEIESELLAPPKIGGMVFVKGGCFDMGDTFGDGKDNEKPVHRVCVDDFYIGKYEVTVGEFREFVRDWGYRTEAEQRDGCVGTGFARSDFAKDRKFNWRNVGFKQNDHHPVACVSWNDAQEYIKWRSVKEGRKYSLPTEAEWEYAARERGKKIRWAGTNDATNLREYAWYGGYSGGTTHPVGQKKPNALGLYDMSGNVWEWVSDWYDEGYYSKSQRDNPRGPSGGLKRIMRGCGWFYEKARFVRTTMRASFKPADRISFIGFRLSLSADVQK